MLRINIFTAPVSFIDGRPTHALVAPKDNCCTVCFPARYGGRNFVDRHAPIEENKDFADQLASVMALFSL